MCTVERAEWKQKIERKELTWMIWKRFNEKIWIIYGDWKLVGIWIFHLFYVNWSSWVILKQVIGCDSLCM